MFGLLIRAIRNTNVTSFHLKVFLIESYFFASHCLTFNKTRSWYITHRMPRCQLAESNTARTVKNMEMML